MTLDAQWERLARDIEMARRSSTLLPGMAAEDLPQDVAACYLVQDRAIALSGVTPRAWKLGAPSYAAQGNMGLAEPFAGPIVPGMLLISPANLASGGYACHKYEPEIAITLGRDIDGQIDIEEARAAIASYHPAIEIINFRIGNGHMLGAKGMLTDLGGNGALILGAAIADGVYDYATLQLEMRINGARATNRIPAPPETDPANMLAWFSGHAASRGYPLCAGDVITTGSQAGLLPYAPGDRIEADFGAAGTASVQC